MKKLLVIGLILAILVSTTLMVFAAPDGFTTSPSEKPGPGVVEFVPRDSECTAELVITPFGERVELSPVLRGLLEKAYNEVLNSGDLSTLNADLAAVAAAMGIPGNMLAVSDLFDIHTTGCDFHEGHFDFDITLSADSLRNFVGLLHMDHSGTWELISDAKVTNDGDHLKFSVEGLSPFAIVVDTTNGSNDNIPDTGDHSMVYLYAALMVISALALVVVLVKGKKQHT